jgi:DNA-binding HxlR family transcriptional regulator
MDTTKPCVERCPIETTLRVIGGKWKSLVLYHVRSGPKRFNELRRLIPNVTQRMLTQHLRELEQDGVLTRTVFAVVPPRVEYSLTPLGHSLTPLLAQMAEWGAAYEGLSKNGPGSNRELAAAS